MGKVDSAGDLGHTLLLRGVQVTTAGRCEALVDHGWDHLVILVLLGQCHQDPRVGPLHSHAFFLLNIGLLVLENGLLADVVDFTVDFSHESDWDIRHQIENINGSPGSSTVKMSWIWQRVCGRTLKENGSLRQEFSSLIIPFLDGNYVLLCAFFDSSIFM